MPGTHVFFARSGSTGEDRLVRPAAFQSLWQPPWLARASSTSTGRTWLSWKLLAGPVVRDSPGADRRVDCDSLQTPIPRTWSCSSDDHSHQNRPHPCRAGSNGSIWLGQAGALPGAVVQDRSECLQGNSSWQTGRNPCHRPFATRCFLSMQTQRAERWDLVAPQGRSDPHEQGETDPKAPEFGSDLGSTWHLFQRYDEHLDKEKALPGEVPVLGWCTLLYGPAHPLGSHHPMATSSRKNRQRRRHQTKTGLETHPPTESTP